MPTRRRHSSATSVLGLLLSSFLLLVAALAAAPAAASPAQTFAGVPLGAGPTKAPAADEAFWQISTFNAANLNPTPSNQAIWAGREAAQEPGWVNAPGYGNNWNTPLDWYGTAPDPDNFTTVRMQFNYNHDLEPAFDFFVVRWDSAGTWIELDRIDGTSVAPVNFDRVWPVFPESYVGPLNDQIHIQLLVTTDGSYSDEDGIIDTSGAVQIDDISIGFFGSTVSLATFQPRLSFGSDGGWTPDGFEWLDIGEGDVAGNAASVGVTWANLTGSLLPDLYVTDFGNANQLLGNFGNGAFVDQTVPPLGDTGFSSGAAAGDFDDDGDTDLVIANAATANVLARNDGTSWANVTPPAIANAGNGRGLAWGDYDGDGDLDLYMGIFDATNRLLRNDGNASFVDVTTGVLADPAVTQSVTWVDYDGDLDVDLALGSGSSSKLLRNDGDGAFVNATPAPLTTTNVWDMAWGDYDNDGDLDVFAGSLGGDNRLLRNDGNGAFADVTSPVVANTTAATAGAVWADYDNDADLDLLLACNNCANQYLVNDGAGNFSPGPPSSFADPGEAFGIGVADQDLDGDLDCYIANFSGPNLLLSNRVGSQRNWLRVTLEGTASNRDGAGARVRVVAGGVSQLREIALPSGSPSGSEKVAHFGLGAATAVDSVIVRWPNGELQIAEAEINSRIEIQQPAPTAGFFRGLSVDTGGVAKNGGAAKLAAVSFYELRPEDSLNNRVSTIDLPFNDVRSVAAGANETVLYVWVPQVGIITVDPVAGTLVSNFAVSYPAGVTPSGTPNAIAYDAVQDRLYLQVLTASGHRLLRLDPTTGEALLLGPISFSGAPTPTSAFRDMAVNEAGNIYGVSQDGGNPVFWLVDPNTLSATAGGSPSTYTVGSSDGIAFLGDELWVLRSGFTTLRVDDTPPNVGTVLQTTSTAGVFLSGLSARRCVPAASPVQVFDAPADSGGFLDVDWAAYSPPPGAASYDVLRSLESCELFDPGLAAIANVSLGVQTYRDAVANYRAFYYGIRVLDAGGNTLETLAGGPDAARANIVLNEFAPAGGVQKTKGSGKRVGELVEIKNLSPTALDLTGFRLSNGPGAPTPDEEALAGVIPAGGFLVVILSTISLPDEGGTLQLLPPPGNGFPFDIVDYGTQGGAPTVPAGFTVNRVPGTDADDFDSSSFEAGEPSTNAENNVAAPELGGSLVLNEVLYTEGVLPNRDYIEIYNRQANVAVLDGIVISDGISFFDTLSTSINLAPGQIVLLEQGLPGSFDSNLQSNLLYMYKITAEGLLKRIDQLGWTGGPAPGPAPGDALVRVPDGAAVYLGNQGANWAESGGDDVLIYADRTPGVANADPRETQVIVNPAGGADYLTINAALADVDLGTLPAGTRIFLADGTYPETVALRSDIQILGLSGDPGAVVLLGDGSGPIVSAVGVSGASLNGVTVRGGLAQKGGGFYGQDAEFSLRQVRFEDCAAREGAPVGPGPGNFFPSLVLGGAAYVEACDAIFDGCLFLRNESESIAGALAAEGNDIVLENCLFVLNEAPSGGAICADDGGGVPASIQIDHCVFDRNFTYNSFSGTIEVYDGSNVQMTYSAVTNDFGASPIVSQGGSVDFDCGALFGGARPVGTFNVSLSNLLTDDPQFCQPLAMNYAYDDLSPLASPPTSCVETIGITGPPCIEIPTSAPEVVVPRASLLHNPMPNPFNPATQLRFDLARPGKVSLALYDARGRRVASLLSEEFLEAGTYQRIWRGTDDRGQRVASGVYFARYSVDGGAVGQAQRLVLLK